MGLWFRDGLPLGHRAKGGSLGFRVSGFRKIPCSQARAVGVDIPAT